MFKHIIKYIVFIGRIFFHFSCVSCLTVAPEYILSKFAGKGAALTLTVSPHPTHNASGWNHCTRFAGQEEPGWFLQTKVNTSGRRVKWFPRQRCSFFVIARVWKIKLLTTNWIAKHTVSHFLFQSTHITVQQKFTTETDQLLTYKLICSYVYLRTLLFCSFVLFRILGTCSQLGLETSSPYHKTLLSLCRNQEPELMQYVSVFMTDIKIYAVLEIVCFQPISKSFPQVPQSHCSVTGGQTSQQTL